MAHEQKHTRAEATEAPALPSMSPDQMALFMALVQEMKKPYVDEDVVARKLRDKERLQNERRIAVANIEAAQDACTHLRDDNTSRIAWIDNSDGIRRGVCQACNVTLAPGHHAYERMRRIPTRMAGIIS